MRENEASMPAVSRIDIRKLAELDKYWGSEGYNIRTISQLISWSVDLLVGILQSNKKSVAIETVSEAYEWMAKRGLGQPSLQNKGRKKMSAALSFENLRAEGIKPEEYVPSQYNTVNRKNSVQPMPGHVVNGEYVSPFEEDYKKAALLKREEEQAEIARLVEAAVKNADANNRLAKNEVVVPPDKASANMNDWEREKKEQDELDELNAPIDLEWLKNHAAKKE